VWSRHPSRAAGKGIVPEYLTVEEIARLLRVSPATARAWNRRLPADGRPRPIKVGARLLWDRAEVEAWLKTRHAGSRQVAS
jgi:excisionase family DNA binding protein